MNIGGLAEKIIAGSGILIGMYLIVSNPNGTKVAANSLTSGGVSAVKALQGR